MPSSIIQTFSYEPATQLLTVTFTTGRIYRYRKVEPETAGAFEMALSKGRFFNLRIRDQYYFEELTSA